LLTKSLKIIEIKETFQESPNTKTFFFDWEVHAKPGQFVMVWLAGVDELPMALSSLGSPKAITVQGLGDATKQMLSLKEGDRLGIRGPYGKPFWLEGERLLLAGGGTGMASLIALVETPPFREAHREIVIGARNKEALLFVDRCRKAGCLVHVATDDGSEGFQGFVPALAEKVLDAGTFDSVYSCGPEIMMKGVFDSARKRGLKVQVSMERRMRCAFGICDACEFGGSLVCADGPVFSGEEIAANPDFCQFRRDKTGRRLPLFSKGPRGQQGRGLPNR